MHVLHIYRTYFPDAQGGLQEAIRQICLACSDFGVESRVFVLSPNPIPNIIDTDEGIIVRSRSWWAPASCDLGGFDAIAQFKQHAKWADVIHFHFPWPFADILNLVSFTNKPAILTYHSDIVKQKKINWFYSPLRTLTLNSMQAIVATSPVYAKTSPVLQKYLNSPKLKMIPLGIAEPKEYMSEAPNAIGYLHKLGISNTPFLLFLGVLRYYKGVHTLVEAADQVHGTIVIAGSGPEERTLKKQVKDLGIKNILFTGEVDEVEKSILLQYCSALVLPSHLRSEAFGMVLIEASMYEKPMICCEIQSGTSYVNVNDKTGLVVEPENPTQLADACNQLLGNPDQARKMGQAARERYETLFSGLALGKNYSELYAEIFESAVAEKNHWKIAQTFNSQGVSEKSK
ncbi:glycosyltransferase [Polynucleobacter paneuropaeus]|nr:glycosyltransferase [Polynucleobacter paneuropaeus]